MPHSCAMEADSNVRVILLKSSGRAFCAGIDVNELAGKSATQYREWIEWMENPLVAISTMKKPVIAQVQGVATANGMGLVAAADLVIASERVKMGLTAINVGLNCVGPILPVARCVGRKKALELLLYGNLLKAQEALDLGLVNKIVGHEELDEAALEMGRRPGTKKSSCRADCQKCFLSIRGHGLSKTVSIYERGLCPTVHHR